MPAGFDTPWVVEGPNNFGGRVSALKIDPRDDDKWYLGFPNGGLWVTSDAGASYTPITEGFTTMSIGAIDIDTDLNRLWVGTGHPAISGYWFTGDGVYYSDDDGGTWTASGLEKTGVVNELRIDPNDSQTMFAATMGKPFVQDADRGLYRSKDGGATWTQVLFISNSVGVSDVRIDPRNSNVVYATAYTRFRTQTESIISSDDALLYKSIDGGDTWVNLQPRIGYALPSSKLGFAMSPSNPDVLYLTTTDESSSFAGLYRSFDAGESWTTVVTDRIIEDGNSRDPFASFGWYFGKTRVDPRDPLHVYIMGVDLYESFDGGDTWEAGDADYVTHADNHQMEWRNDGQVLLGDDGGLHTQFENRGPWSDIESIPTNKFYRVATIPGSPRTYSGGMQDNGSAYGGLNDTGLEWQKVWGGDGFQTAHSPTDDNGYIMMTQNGEVYYYDGGGVNFISPDPAFSDPRSWDMPHTTRYDGATETTYVLTATNRPYETIWDGIFDCELP